MSIRRWAPLLTVATTAVVLGLGDGRCWAIVSRHDKLAHAMALALLALATRHAAPRMRTSTIALACVAAAIVVEAAQAFLPGRTASIDDVWAGLAGAGFALGGLHAVSVLRRGVESCQE